MATTKNKGMRVKDVGATINLGNYSSLHVTIGEESEFAGLDIGKAQTYLQSIAQAVNGVLNLPVAAPEKKQTVTSPGQEKLFAYGSGEMVLYDHENHAYTDKNGTKYTSVTQMVEKFYPFDLDVIEKEYMDFAASYGNMIHTAIQNAVIGKAPKKAMVKGVIDDVLSAMSEIAPIQRPIVESIVALPEYAIAGRFDILTENKNGNKILWDVKTNSDVYKKTDCSMDEDLIDYLSQYWGVDTLYGEHCLQLNVYAYILEHHCGFTIDAIKIIHTPDGFSQILDVPKVDISPVLEAYKKLA